MREESTCCRICAPAFSRVPVFHPAVTLISDHKSLKDAFKKKDLQGQLAKWLDFLSEYEFTV